jgi:hypothetical protein
MENRTTSAVLEHAKKKKLSLLPDRYLKVFEPPVCFAGLGHNRPTSRGDLPGKPPDLPGVHYALAMPGARREDATAVSILATSILFMVSCRIISSRD